MTQELVGAGKMLSKGVLRAIWLEKNHCWREFVTFYYAFLESHSLPHHNFSQVQRSFLLWNIYSTLVPLPGEREIDTLLCILESVQDFLINLDTKQSCHCQTYQNYEQSRQKLGTILEYLMVELRLNSEGDLLWLPNPAVNKKLI